MEIDEFQETTEISLDDLRHAVPGFVAPQMYIYLDGTELLDYIEHRVEMRDTHIENKFCNIDSQSVCIH